MSIREGATASETSDSSERRRRRRGKRPVDEPEVDQDVNNPEPAVVPDRRTDPVLDQRGVHNSRRPSPYYRRGGGDFGRYPRRSNYRRQDPDHRSYLRRRRSPSPNRLHLELLDTPEKIDDAMNELRHRKSQIFEQRPHVENSQGRESVFNRVGTPPRHDFDFIRERRHPMARPLDLNRRAESMSATSRARRRPPPLNEEDLRLRLGRAQAAPIEPNARPPIQDPILADLFAKISQMERRMSETNEGGRQNAPKKEPLAPEVEHAPMQYEIQPFQTTLYDGKSDPESHLNRFRTYMSGRGASDATRCKLFPLTLGDLAHRWYVGLPPLSIHCFDELAQHFMSHFASKVNRLERSQRLIGIRQELGESDESYVDRVGELLLIGEEVGDDLKLHTAMSGLSRDSELFKYLMLNYPKNYEDFRVKAGQQIWLQKLTRKEEDTRDQRKKPSTQPEKKNLTGSKKPTPPKNLGNFRSFPDPTEIEVNLIEQTGHNPANIMQILQVSGSGLLVKPGPLRAPANKLDVRKWCAFHEAHGHLTGECRDLLRQLWKLFEDGKLWDFIVRPGQRGGDRGKEPNVSLQGPSQQQLPPFQPPPRGGQIHMLGGLIPITGESRRKRKRDFQIWEIMHEAAPPRDPVISKNAIITFTPEDREGVSYPKGDALVVSATILGMVVARVLVDNGAFCNLIFKSALDQMGNLVEYIRPCDWKLKGFGDAEVHPYGVITLPLEIVDYKNKEIKMIRSVDFVIVDRQSAYNAFLGRPFLEAFEAVASTHYFCVKFPTPCGVVGTVKGDQVMAKKCFMYSYEFLNNASQVSVSESSFNLSRFLLQHSEASEGKNAKTVNNMDSALQNSEVIKGAGDMLRSNDNGSVPQNLKARGDVDLKLIQSSDVAPQNSKDIMGADTTKENLSGNSCPKDRENMGTRTSTRSDYIPQNYEDQKDHKKYHNSRDDSSSGQLKPIEIIPSSIRDVSLQEENKEAATVVIIDDQHLTDSEPKPHGRTIPSREPKDQLKNCKLKSQSAFEMTESLEIIQFDPAYADRDFQIGTQMKPEVRSKLISFLKENRKTFAWTNDELGHIDPKHACHRLKIDPKRKPIAQKRRKYGPEKYEALAGEVKKLLDSNLVEVAKEEPQWLSNAVMIKKTSNAWRLCIDYTDLNDACPKDHFPMPHVNHLVDSTAGHAIFSIMDAKAGYHQIPMHPDDIKHTAFYTEKNICCWLRMPFGLKNAGATYQRLVNTMFADQIGKTMEVYIDDILVNSDSEEAHVGDLTTTFGILNRYNMRLNPKKCHFGIKKGKFLGHIVGEKGIEPNPDKIKAILEMQEPRDVKGVQRLTGCLAALSRFMSRLGDKTRPFFAAIKNKKFRWNKESQEAFQKIKECLMDPQILTKPHRGEKLFLYLAASEYAVSAVLTRAEAQHHLPIYYVSQVLHEAEIRYTPLEKLVYALVTSIRRLRAYLFEHPVEVLTSMPLRQVLHRSDSNGRLLKWSLEIRQYDLTFAPRTAIKAQALADFIVELTFPKKSSFKSKPWKLYVDGSATNLCSGAGVVLNGPDGESFAQAIKFEFPTTNNEAEYEALVAGLELTLAIDVQLLHIFMDSQLVVNQVKGEFEAKGDHMIKYLELVWKLCEKIPHVLIEQIPRELNSQADALSKLASAVGTADLSNIMLTRLENASIWREAELLPIESAMCDDWRTSIIQFIESGILPEDRMEAKRIQMRAAKYSLIGSDLYRRSYSLPLLKCLSKNQGQEVLLEIHEGICGNHAGGRSLAHKAMSLGFYWPTMRKDAIDYARKCLRCQVTGPNIVVPPETLNAIYSPWPFARWGIDLIGPLPTAPGGVKFAFVAIDYFTKWVEAEAVQKIDQAQVIKFIWRNIICRFGLPDTIISDNGKQFDGFQVSEFCERWKIRRVFATPYHPQTNGQVEAANKILKHTLKAKLEERKGKWASELHEVLWSYRTTAKNATGETPYSLAFGTEAVIPAEVSVSSYRTSQQVDSRNEEALRVELDLLEEKRLKADVKNAATKQRVARFFDSKVKARKFEIGDLVLKKILGTHVGALGSTWEGPFKVTRCLANGAYELELPDGTPDQYRWNAAHLKKFYV